MKNSNFILLLFVFILFCSGSCESPQSQYFITIQNDSDKEIEDICKFIKSIDREIPLHFSAFHGAYKMKDVPPTSRETLNRAYDIAKDLHLEYVYVGNILDDERQNTYCPACGELIIERSGYLGEQVSNKMVRTNHCPRCGYTIKGIF